MQFTVLRQSLRSALDSIKATVKPNTQANYSDRVKFDIQPQEMTLTGYDLETGIIAAVDVDTLNSGEFLVNLDKLTAIVAKLSGETLECTVNGNNDGMTIKCGRSKVKIPTEEADAYPSIPSLETDSCFVMSGATLADMIRQTVFAVAVADNKPVLKGELFDIENNSCNLVAVDGFRLAIRTEAVSTDERYKFVVKGDTLKSVSRLAKDGDVTLIPSKKHIIFDFGKTKIFTRLLEGDFHNYKSSVPSNSNAEAVISTKPLIECLERFALLIDSKSKSPLRCVFNSGKLEMSLKTIQGEMSDSVDIDFTGTPVTIGFNNQFLLDTLKASESDKVKLNLNGALSPMTVKPLDGNAYTYLVLPVRLKNE